MSRDPLRAALRAFDDTIAASPGDETLKARRAQLELAASDLPALRARLAEVEAAMQAPIADGRRALELMQARDRLLAEIREITQ